MNFSLSFPPETLLIIGIVLTCYFVVSLFLGVYFSRFSSNINDFFFSGQRFSWWLPTMSMVATGIGSYSYLKYSEQGLNTGMSSTQVYFNDWFLFPIFLFGWMPILYFNRIKSVPEYFEKRFNSLARYLSVFIILAYIFYYIGFNLFTIGVAIEGLFGISVFISLPVITAMLGIYVTLGGQTAVIFTDLFQGIILYLVGLVVIGCGIYALGGFGEFWAYLPESHRTPFAGLNENPYYNTSGIFWGDALVASVAFLYMNQGFLMRFLTIRNLNHVRKAAFFNITVTVPLSALVIGGLGWVAKSILTKQKALGGALEGYTELQIDNSYHTFLLTAYHVIKQNPWIMGFIFSALIAALMSTVDSLINAAAAIGIYDVYKPLIKPQAGEKHYLKMARWVSFISTAAGLLLVIWFYKQKGTLMSIHYKGIMLIIPPVVTSIFLGVLWKNFHAFSASVSMTIGIAVTFLTVIYPEPVYFLREVLLGVSEGDIVFFRAPFGVMVTALAGGVCQIFFPKSKMPALVEKIKKSSEQPIDPKGSHKKLWKIQAKTKSLFFKIMSVFVQGADKNVFGFTVDSLKEAMFKYKGGFPNLKLGKPVKGLSLKLNDELNWYEILLSKNICEKMGAEKGDLVYLSDNRWYLGGVRSGHFRLRRVLTSEDEVFISSEAVKRSYLLLGKKVCVEKNL